MAEVKLGKFKINEMAADVTFPMASSGSNLTLGEEDGTAYEGSKGKRNADNIDFILKQIPGLNELASFEIKDQFPEPGVENKFYLDKSTNKIYRWDGEKYVEVSSDEENAEQIAHLLDKINALLIDGIFMPSSKQRIAANAVISPLLKASTNSIRSSMLSVAVN